MGKSIKLLGIALLLSLFPIESFSQTINKEALNSISYSAVPFADKKGARFPNSWGVSTPSGVSDKLYTDLQCTQFFHVGDNEDLQPTLYLKIKIPNSNYVIGDMYYGGATDNRVDIVFIADTLGNIKSSLEGTVQTYNLSIKQYKVTEDYKIVTSQMMPTSQNPILFDDFIRSNQPVEAYRLDTTYRINSNGEFVKEKEAKLPTKTYTKKLLIENEIWDL